VTISVTDIYNKLLLWGYEANLEPEYQKVPGKIGLTYDMGAFPEDVAMTSYEVTHKVILDWTEAQPDTIATTVTTLMGHLGVEYSMLNRFRFGDPKITRGNGTMYKVALAVYWVEWVTIDR